VRRLSATPLLERHDLGGGYQVLVFGAEQAIEALPGQFAMVRSMLWGQAPLLPRPMSLLDSGDKPSILIKVVGDGTRRMAEAPLGEQFALLAPLGTSWSEPASEEQPLLVAGGVGVAPLIFLAEHLAARGRRDVVSLYGGRSDRDLPLAERLEAAGELEISTEDGSRGTRGLVTVLLERRLEANRKVHIYTCGPHAMMAAVAALAERFSVPCDASLEAPMGCGYGVCLGCSVARAEGGYLYTCIDGPCVDAGAIDWQKRVF
jgi:dihydroorotate dehydrogenase electron transfer subunit